MKTVDKAFAVLDQFSMEHMEIGLSELSRMSGIDKAATRRLLVALSEHGFIEQVAETRKYRLGHGFLRLARIREATVPVTQAAREVCDWLIEQVDETVHISLPGESAMTTIAHRLPRRGNVINIQPAEPLYYHATASGLAFLSFASPATADRILALPRQAMTAATVTDEDALRAQMASFRAQGYSHTKNTFENDVSSIAMPVFGDGSDPVLSIAIALPKNDLTDARRDELLPFLKDATAKLERALTGLG